MQATATLEDRVRAWEAEFLSDLATPSYPAKRQVEEPDSPLRTPFQRDRDRIVHSKAFRRLKHKTQVFIAPEGDHYRTRLTHTLEACGIARTVARALGLNEDLTEAIGLGHDLGHPPFGHTGEDALDAALRERCGSGFRHNVHSLRVVDALERDGPGAEPDRAGARRHPQPHRLRSAGDAGGADRQAGRPRRLHQPRHRRRPAGGDTARRGTCPPPRSSCSGRPGRSGSTRWSATSSSARAAAGEIEQSEEVGGAMLRLRKFMFDRVYLGEAARREQERVHGAVRGLFDHYLEHLGETPESEPGASDCQRVADYIAGMTDRYCIARFAELTVPEEARF